MARAKTKKSFFKSRRFVYLIAILVVIIAGFYLYNKHSVSANKKNFEDARTAIDDIYNAAYKQVGHPDNAVLSSFCSKTYKEFTGYTDLTCEDNIKFIYTVNNEPEANDLFKQIQRNISEEEKDFKPTDALSNSIKDSFAGSTVYHSASDTYSSHNLKCVVNYIYDTPREIDLSIKDPSKKPFEITIGCSGPAKQQYYRLAS